jgi:hypothetical protein
MAMPQRRPPQISVEGPRNPVSTEMMSACAAIAIASPVVSLNGRSAVNQKSGDISTTSVAQNAIQRLVAPGLTLTRA